MDYSKLPKINIRGIILAMVLGVAAAIGFYQAQLRGLIPGWSMPGKQVQETRTILQEENAVISVVEKSSPSVVAIVISQKIINPFDPSDNPQKIDSTIGTGFVVSTGAASADNKNHSIIVTNKHVISNITQYSVVTKDGQKYDIRKIYRDPDSDLAIVQIEANNLKPLELGDSSKLKVGQTLIAIGNALGKYTNTVTTGIVSGLGRKVVAGNGFEPAENLDNLIQTDAAINPGNSGGPLLNSLGQVIGINVATTDGAQNIGFALPINAVKKTVDEFISNGFVLRPYLGVSYKFIPKDLADLNSLLPGAFVQSVIENSPAAKSGIKSGDIITKIGDQVIDSEARLSEIISKSQIKQQLELSIFRQGKELLIKVILEESPGQ